MYSIYFVKHFLNSGTQKNAVPIYKKACQFNQSYSVMTTSMSKESSMGAKYFMCCHNNRIYDNDFVFKIHLSSPSCGSSLMLLFIYYLLLLPMSFCEVVCDWSCFKDVVLCVLSCLLGDHRAKKEKTVCVFVCLSNYFWSVIYNCDSSQSFSRILLVLLLTCFLLIPSCNILCSFQYCLR